MTTVHEISLKGLITEVAQIVGTALKNNTRTMEKKVRGDESGAKVSVPAPAQLNAQEVQAIVKLIQTDNRLMGLVANTTEYAEIPAEAKEEYSKLQDMRRILAEEEKSFRDKYPSAVASEKDNTAAREVVVAAFNSITGRTVSNATRKSVKVFLPDMFPDTDENDTQEEE